jgi:DNA-binding GntR family transcriptional regulator
MDSTLPAARPAEPAARTRSRARALTIPEQIADRLAAAIVNGEYGGGERLREQELAEAYGVSRGPVREALRALEGYGLAVLRPRRGAYAVGLSLDVIAEAFNARAALAGIAARQLARRPDAVLQAVPEMEALLDRAETMVDVADASTAFQFTIHDTARCIYRHCGAGHLERALSDHLERSIYGLVWRLRSWDYDRREGREDSVARWRRIVAALAAGDDRATERLVRDDIFGWRDKVLGTLAAMRGLQPDPALLPRDQE